MFNWLKQIFNKNYNVEIHFNKEKELENSGPHELPFIWCLIGNIIDEHLDGKEKILKHGTKHFSPNTKVYCFPVKWGDGYEDIIVIGKHRKSFKSVVIVMPSKFITNWRLQKVYKPNVLKLMRSQDGWTNSDKDKETILGMLEWLPDRTIKT